MDFSFDSIAIVPELKARAIFHSDSSKVFREDKILCLIHLCRGAICIYTSL